MGLRMVPLLLLAVLAIFLFRGLTLNPKVIPSSLVNQPAPTFSLTTLTNTKQPLSNQTLLGRPYLLHVWRSGCEACQTEHLTLLTLAKQKKIAIYGLLYKDNASLAKEFLAQMGNPYQAIFLDTDGRVGLDFGVYGTPETFLIDAKGIIRDRWVGNLRYDK